MKLQSLFRVFLPNQKIMTRAGMAARMALVYVAINLMGLWVAREWYYDRPLCNIDYVLVALVYLWISRTLAAALLVALFFTECARYLIPTYFFTQQAFSLLFWTRAMTNWSPVILLAISAAVCGLIVAVTLLFRRYWVPWRLRVEATFWVCAATALLMLADSVNGTNSIYNIRNGSNLFDINFSGSPLYVVSRKTLDTLRGEPAKFTPIPPETAATGRYFSELLSSPDAPADLSKGVESLLTAANRDRLPDKLVVVVFESLSVLTGDAQLRDWEKPFQRVENRYTIETGTLDWNGATFRGEVRELCWQSLDGHEIQSLPPSLPATFKKLGYETDAFHGFYKTMYDRDRIYPLLGFEKPVFLDELRRQGDVPLVGTLFHGASDSFVASQVHQALLRPGKKLVYWMTLSSHVPVNNPFARQIATPEELASAGELPAAVWGYRVICRRTLESIAAIAADESLDDCDFIIVGDHSIPITSAGMRSYFEPNKVAYLILRHKKSGAQAAN
jgi:hypothetical protein